MAGRPPKPTAIKLLEGNPGKRPLNETEPHPALGASRPSWLPEKGRKFWPKMRRQVESMGVLTKVDDAGLALFCDALADYLMANESVEKHGLIFEDTRYDREGNVLSSALKANPAMAMKADSWRRMNLMLQQFGLTPASRAKVKVEKPEEVDEFEELMRRQA